MTSGSQSASPPHLRLAIRTTPRLAFLVQGDREREIGRRFSSGKAAISAIRTYCRTHGCTAFVQIFYPKAERWREDRVARDGTLQSIYLGVAHEPATAEGPRTNPSEINAVER